MSDIISLLENDAIDNITTIDWKYIWSNYELSNKFIEKYIDYVDWSVICIKQNLSDEFIDKYNNKIKWILVSGYQKMSETIIEKYINYINWDFASHFQVLSEKFIDKYNNLVDWKGISMNQKMSESFIEKYDNKIIFVCLFSRYSNNRAFSYVFLKKYLPKINDGDKIYIVKYHIRMNRFIRIIKEFLYKPNGPMYIKVMNNFNKKIKKME